MPSWPLLLLFACVSGACSEERKAPLKAVPAAEPVPMSHDEPAPGGPVANLPFSQGRSFATLDEYLAFLQERGAADVPWYRRTRDGRYELISFRGRDTTPRYYTREELERRFGFAR